ncbi:EAL domain-containing protein (putative c-di-GMP-specific phosphodiesterase class I) [Scandinavium goeteborgense]|uniref:EAL domain-containing protein (Putative c-di-GMP-specific phosphodiesterase class I) n=2 Tax=Scandinavium goeteborgense TaxID=1851514 RepID=A0A4R6EMM4_SCAGO|nr:EAL domain-containing protein (putative c-di-GMP-specific phosphodiesterase class I) [Scandinavium goeteborgense]
MEKSSLKAYPFTLLKSVMIILLVALLVMILCATGLLNYQSRKAGNLMNEQLLNTQSEMVQLKLGDFLDNPHQLSLLMQKFLQGGQAAVDDGMVRPELVYLGSRAFADMQAMQSFSWTDANGNYFSVKRDSTTGRIFLERSTPQDPTQLITYSGISEQSNIVKSVNNFNVNSFSWFHIAQHQRNPWWISEPGVKGHIATYHLPIYTKEGQFAGVISTGLMPAKMSGYLAQLLPSKDYSLLILDEDQHVVASTDNAMTPDKLPSSLTHETEDCNCDKLTSFHVNGKRFMAKTFDVRDSEYLLKWHGVLVAPHQATLATTRQQHLMITLASAAVILLLMAAISLVILRFTGSLKETAGKVKEMGFKPWKKESKKRTFPELKTLNEELERVAELMPSMGAQRTSLEEDAETGFLTLGGLMHTPALYDNRNLLAMIKVSNFNSVKNALGSALAKEFIQSFAERLRSILPEGALCCRDREDTFIIAFTGTYESKDVAWYRGVITSVFREQSAEIAGESHIFTGHAGMIIEPLTEEGFSECLRNVSLAVQHTQNQRNGACDLYTPEMREEEVNNLRLHQALRDDLQTEGFHLVLQPIVPFAEQVQCTEGECLIRWQSNVLGFVPPDRFIALAEHTGMIVPLGKWIIDTACRELATFIARGAPPDFKLHINISAVQLQQADFSRHLLECIHRYELHNNNICIEITESVLLHDTHRIVEILAYLRRLGISVAIDDFGSGYSSLSYLHSLPFDCLKIDRGFVRNVLEDKKSEAVIASVLMLSRSFEVPLVAEGVETAEMAAKLHEMGCDLAQGYYYSRPKPFADFVTANGQFIVQPE